MNTEKATFAAGCFWGTERYFKKEFGDRIINGKVGYTGGAKENPGYEEVCSGKTGHTEAYEFEFDPAKTDFKDLCVYFFRFHDPTTLNSQGNDRGTQYRSGIYYHNENQKVKALEAVAEVQPKIKSPILTEILPAMRFFIAEKYHQQYLDMNPSGYCNHRIRF